MFRSLMIVVVLAANAPADEAAARKRVEELRGRIEKRTQETPQS
jgi:hypothetical protein